MDARGSDRLGGHWQPKQKKVSAFNYDNFALNFLSASTGKEAFLAPHLVWINIYKTKIKKTLILN